MLNGLPLSPWLGCPLPQLLCPRPHTWDYHIFSWQEFYLGFLKWVCHFYFEVDWWMHVSESHLFRSRCTPLTLVSPQWAKYRGRILYFRVPVGVITGSADSDKFLFIKFFKWMDINFLFHESVNFFLKGKNFDHMFFCRHDFTDMVANLDFIFHKQSKGLQNAIAWRKNISEWRKYCTFTPGGGSKGGKKVLKVVTQDFAKYRESSHWNFWRI